MKMPKKMRDKWVKALRSGEYGQCKETLTDGKGSFCCLGVLQHVVSGGSCEVYGPEDKYTAGQYRGLPSSEWYASVGMEGSSESDVEETLTMMNDGGVKWNGKKHVEKRSKSFSKIADFIEKNVEVY